MRIWIALFFLYPIGVLAQTITPAPTNSVMDSPSVTVKPYSQSEMFNITVEAAEKRPDVALLMHNTENWFWRNAGQVGITQNDVAPVAVVAAPLVAHKVSTRVANMDWKPSKDLTLRPDVDYYFLTKETHLAFSVGWRF